MVAVTNVTTVWNAGDLEFRQGEPGNASGPLLANISGSANGIHAQWGTTATAATNGLLLNANFYLTVTDNTGTTYYIAAADAVW